MKSEHRHELQTNDLSKLADKASHTLEAYYNQIMIGVCGVLLIAAVWIWWVRSERVAEAAAWADIAACRSPEEFAAAAEAHPGTEAARWARLQEAEGYLSTGLRETFTDREKALTDLGKAKERYEALLADRSLGARLRERAMFGYARALEATAGSDLTPAIEAYENLLKEFPNSPFAAEAKEQVAALKDSRMQSFYAWFQQQNPKPPEPAKPQDGGAPTMGSVPGSSPTGIELPRLDLNQSTETADESAPKFDVEKALNPQGPATEGAASAAPESAAPATSPASDAAPKTESTPEAAAKPETPAGEAKPQEKPAESAAPADESR